MHSLNQINFINMQNGKRKSLIIGKDKLTYEKVIDKQTGLENHTYYCDLVVSADRIYALWMDQAYEDAFDVPKNQEIHVFDWSGKPIARWNIPEYIYKFTIDHTHQFLYGLGIEENVYRYPLKEVL